MNAFHLCLMYIDSFVWYNAYLTLENSIWGLHRLILLSIKYHNVVFFVLPTDLTKTGVVSMDDIFIIVVYKLHDIELKCLLPQMVPKDLSK